MNDNIKVILCALAFIILMCGIIFLALSVRQQDPCELMNKTSCEYYSCMAEKTKSYFESNNYLLKEQNCILKEIAMEKTK